MSSTIQNTTCSRREEVSTSRSAETLRSEHAKFWPFSWHCNLPAFTRQNPLFLR